LNKKIDFIIAGFQKCGTTSLATILAKHPDIDFSRNKEPNFFSKKIITEIEFFDNFDWKSSKLKGEGSISYSFIFEYPHVIRSLYNHNPALKIIFIGRNPVDRIRSHFSHRRLRGTLNSPKYETEILRNPDYINRSLYSRVILEYLRFFTPQQILLFTLEDLVSKTEKCLNQLEKFLNISEFPQKKFIQENKSYNVPYSTRKWNDVRRYFFIQILPEKIKKYIKMIFFSRLIKSEIHFDQSITNLIRKKTYKDYKEFLGMVGSQKELFTK